MSTRDKIKGTARRLFGNSGFDGVSVRDIAGEAGVNVSAVSYHFGGKEELFREVVQDGLAEFRKIFMEIGEEPLPFREKTQILMETFLEFLTREDSISRILMSEIAVGGHRLPDIAGGHFEITHKMFQELIRQGIEAGELRPVDETLTMLQFVSFPVYLIFAQPIVEIIRGQKGYSRAFIKKAAHHAVSVLFDGLTPRTGFSHTANPGGEPDKNQ